MLSVIMANSSVSGGKISSYFLNSKFNNLTSFKNLKTYAAIMSEVVPTSWNWILSTESDDMTRSTMLTAR